MIYSVNGVVSLIGDTTYIKSKNGGNDFSKREIWIAPIVFDENTGAAIPRDARNSIVLEASLGQCEKLGEFKPGEAVTITFDIQGRTFTRKDGTQACVNSLVVKSIWPAKNCVVVNRPGGAAPAKDFDTSAYVLQQQQVQQQAPQQPAAPQPQPTPQPQYNPQAPAQPQPQPQPEEPLPF